MGTHQQVVVTEALRYGWEPETKQSWVDLKVDDENTLRLKFPDEFPPMFKICLQALQGHVSEERRKSGLPAIEHTYVVAVQRLEFHRDDVNQIALIRTRFQNGASQDTPIEKKHIRQTIEFLVTALQAFEKLSRGQKH